MPKSKTVMQEDWSDPDDAADLSTPEWIARFNSVEVSRGRPLLSSPKIFTTLRLNAAVLEKFKAQGPKWQTRINAALREYLKLTG